MSSMSLVQVESGEVIIDHEDFVEALQEYDKLVENKQRGGCGFRLRRRT